MYVIVEPLLDQVLRRWPYMHYTCSVWYIIVKVLHCFFLHVCLRELHLDVMYSINCHIHFVYKLHLLCKYDNISQDSTLYDCSSTLLSNCCLQWRKLNSTHHAQWCTAQSVPVGGYHMTSVVIGDHVYMSSYYWINGHACFLLTSPL